MVQSDWKIGYSSCFGDVEQKSDVLKTQSLSCLCIFIFTLISFCLVMFNHPASKSVRGGVQFLPRALHLRLCLFLVEITVRKNSSFFVTSVLWVSEIICFSAIFLLSICHSGGCLPFIRTVAPFFIVELNQTSVNVTQESVILLILCRSECVVNSFPFNQQPNVKTKTASSSC